MVLISDELFHELWLKLLAFKKRSVYRLSPHYKKKFEELQKTLFYGIIRLDKLSDDFNFAKEWWAFFNKLSTDETLGMHQIRGAIFKSWQHVSLYYEHSIKKILDIIEANNESNGF